MGIHKGLVDELFSRKTYLTEVFLILGDENTRYNNIVLQGNPNQPGEIGYRNGLENEVKTYIKQKPKDKFKTLEKCCLLIDNKEDNLEVRLSGTAILSYLFSEIFNKIFESKNTEKTLKTKRNILRAYEKREKTFIDLLNSQDETAVLATTSLMSQYLHAYANTHSKKDGRKTNTFHALTRYRLNLDQGEDPPYPLSPENLIKVLCTNALQQSFLDPTAEWRHIDSEKQRIWRFKQRRY